MSATETCHCGRALAYGFDGNPSHTRGMCLDCDSTRCDAYPLDCPYRHEIAAQDDSGGRVDPEADEFAQALERGEVWGSPVEILLERHRWTGGYFCDCGAEMNSPQTWSRHVLEEAWEEFAALGVEAGRLAEKHGLADQ